MRQTHTHKHTHERQQRLADWQQGDSREEADLQSLFFLFLFSIAVVAPISIPIRTQCRAASIICWLCVQCRVAVVSVAARSPSGRRRVAASDPASQPAQRGAAAIAMAVPCGGEMRRARSEAAAHSRNSSDRRRHRSSATGNGRRRRMRSVQPTRSLAECTDCTAMQSTRWRPFGLAHSEGMRCTGKLEEGHEQQSSDDHSSPSAHCSLGSSRSAQIADRHCPSPCWSAAAPRGWSSWPAWP